MDQKTFITEVANSLGCDAGRAETVTFIVFQELHDRLTPKEAADVAAQLPGGLKQLWQEEREPGDHPGRANRPEFVGRVRQRAVLPDDAEAERAIRAVFGELQKLLGSPSGMEGEAWDIFSQLPKDLKKLWLDSASKRVPA